MRPPIASLSRSRRSLELESRSRLHRSSLTPSEERLWLAIRGGQLGVHFKRQVPLIGRFIADFYAPSLRLVIEVDGNSHANRRSADARRDRKLERAGYRVVRISARAVMTDLGGAVQGLRAQLTSRFLDRAG